MKLSERIYRKANNLPATYDDSLAKISDEVAQLEDENNKLRAELKHALLVIKGSNELRKHD